MTGSQIDHGKRAAPALQAPSMHSLPHAACLAVHDPFMGEWEPDRGLVAALSFDPQFDAGEALTAVNASIHPAPFEWMTDRLTLLWLTFMAGRAADERALTVWMSETSRLLSDIPHDILAHSFDTAIKSSRHGFMPSIGEIRAHADPLVEERKIQISRLERMVRRQADPDAMAALQRRAAEIMTALAATAPQ